MSLTCFTEFLFQTNMSLFLFVAENSYNWGLMSILVQFLQVASLWKGESWKVPTSQLIHPFSPSRYCPATHTAMKILEKNFTFDFKLFNSFMNCMVQ